jgi:hypothetical protein
MWPPPLLSGILVSRRSEDSIMDNENDAYLMGNNANGGTSPAIKNNVGNAAGIKTDDHGVQPRISFAWNPVITWSCAVDMR